jgi:hypothetical protein
MVDRPTPPPACQYMKHKPILPKVGGFVECVPGNLIVKYSCNLWSWLYRLITPHFLPHSWDLTLALDKLLEPGMEFSGIGEGWVDSG